MKLGLTEKQRAYIYRALLGLAPLVVFYGLMSQEEVALWAAAAATWLGVGLATANTTTKE